MILYQLIQDKIQPNIFKQKKIKNETISSRDFHDEIKLQFKNPDKYNFFSTELLFKKAKFRNIPMKKKE